jgi:hypothetical protein
MTWADSPGISQDYIYDKIYEKGTPGPNKDPNTEWFNLYTVDNPNIDQREVSIRAAQMSEEMRQVRIYGQSIRFSNRIHPLFTDQPQTWCMKCRQPSIAEQGICTKCKSNDVESFVHVKAVNAHPSWPVIHLLDCHPRKAHMGLLVQITPADDWAVLQELVVGGDPLVYRTTLDDEVKALKIRVTAHLMDPNMGGSPASSTRDVTWQTEFARCGVDCELADDGAPGRAIVDDLLKVDHHTRVPRLLIHPRCTTTILQMKRYCWAESRNPDQRGMRQVPEDKHSDMPTLLKYLANFQPRFNWLRQGPQPVCIIGRR